MEACVGDFFHHPPVAPEEVVWWARFFHRFDRSRSFTISFELVVMMQAPLSTFTLRSIEWTDPDTGLKEIRMDKRHATGEMKRSFCGLASYGSRTRRGRSVEGVSPTFNRCCADYLGPMVSDFHAAWLGECADGLGNNRPLRKWASSVSGPRGVDRGKAFCFHPLLVARRRGV